MSMKPEQTVSNLWSCETLKAGIDHVMTAAKAEPVSDDEAERELLKQLQDRPKIQYLFSSNMFIGSIGFESVCTCMFSTGHWLLAPQEVESQIHAGAGSSQAWVSS